MAEPIQVGPLIHIAGDAQGQPGQRRFRLMAMNEAGQSAFLWLEKEQLSALGDAIENVLNAESYEHQRPLTLAPEDVPVYPLNATWDFRLGQLSMGVDRENHQVVLIASDGAEPDEDGVTTLNMSFDYALAFVLRRQIVEVVAAGRPPCPLCSGPMDPSGHVCVRTNGHNPH